MRFPLVAITVCLCAAAITQSASAQTQIRVTLTTNGPVGLAPALIAFDDGDYDLFNTGGMASPGLEDLAEVGDLSTAIVEATAAGANAVGFAPGGPFTPSGGTGETLVTVDAGDSSLSFAAMVLPSNDWFIGTGTALDVSALLGAAPGSSLEFTFSTVYDAGTEAEDFAFAPGGGLVGITTSSDPMGGTSTSDTISIVSGPDPFASFANIEPGSFDTSSIDFTGGTVATLRLQVVPEPTTSVLMLGGFGIALVGWRRIRS